MPEILASLSSKMNKHEFYSPFPKNYKPGRTKFIIVTGSVMSGIGKGIFTASLAKLLKDRGMKVAPIKAEAYLNIDSGTLNPFRHGEVFVLDDGTETDLDLGTYERFLEENLTKRNFTTSGQIFARILKKERRGDYLGRDVQFVPHLTGEIKNLLREFALKSKADVILMEVGGTVGDLENAHYLEALRELSYEEGKDNVCFINLTYILEPQSLGEHKSKAAQQGIRKLMELGIQPDIVVCRSHSPINSNIKEKISLFSNVPLSRVVNAHDIESIYSMPLYLRLIGIDEIALKTLKLENEFKIKDSGKALKAWTKKSEAVAKRFKRAITIGIGGKYIGSADTYISIMKALEHCSAYLDTKINIKWVDTTRIENIKKALTGVNGIIVPGGFGARGTEGKIACIKYAREHNMPFLGLCYGFQMGVIEFARNVCSLGNANSTEIDPKTKYPVIRILPEQEEIKELGGSMRLGGYDVLVKKGTLTHKLYHKDCVRERFRHRYNVNTQYIDMLEKAGLVFSGRAPKKRIMQILELPKNKFHIATQFHPEFTSKPLKPDPLFLGFIQACIS